MRAYKALLIFLLITGLALGLLRGAMSPSPYVRLSSGPVVPLSQGGPSLSLTTVNAAQLTWGGYFLVRLFGEGNDLAPYSEESSPSVEAEDTMDMSEAKLNGGILATFLVTGVVAERFIGSTVSDTVTGMPANKAGVRPGDVVVGVNGQRDVTPKSIATALQARAGGADVLSIIRDHLKRKIVVTPVWSTGTWKIGVYLTEKVHVNKSELPKPPNTGSVEGPSAGLMITLADINALSHGVLSKTALAGTGTISINGYVGAIGGVQYKVAGAIANGDKVFLVPGGNYAQAKKSAKGRIDVVEVNSLGGALTWLCTHGATSSVCKEKQLGARLTALAAS